MKNNIINNENYFHVHVVYNRFAFERALKSIENTDILSKADMQMILNANDFMRQKTYGMLTNRYLDFKIEYIRHFFGVITELN